MRCFDVLCLFVMKYHSSMRFIHLKLQSVHTQKIVFRLIISVYSEHYFNKLFTFVQLGIFIHQIYSTVSTSWPNHVVSCRVGEWSRYRCHPTSRREIRYS